MHVSLVRMQQQSSSSGLKSPTTDSVEQKGLKRAGEQTKCFGYRRRKMSKKHGKKVSVSFKPMQLECTEGSQHEESDFRDLSAVKIALGVI